MTSIGKLRAWLAQRRMERRAHNKHVRRFNAWLAQNPGGAYAEFYAAETRRRIDNGENHATLGVGNLDTDAVRTRAQRVLDDFKRAGCLPHHVVVDYGCGSLWVGEAFMAYLNPGNYIGLDVSDLFFAEGLTRIAPSFLVERKPVVEVISDETLRAAQSRKPDFIFSIAVLHHVPPDELAQYFARIIATAAPGSRIDITHNVGWWSRRQVPRRWRHGRFAIMKALEPLGYTAIFDRKHGIMIRNNGFAIVRK